MGTRMSTHSLLNPYLDPHVIHVTSHSELMVLKLMDVLTNKLMGSCELLEVVFSLSKEYLIRWSKSKECTLIKIPVIFYCEFDKNFLNAYMLSFNNNWID